MSPSSASPPDAPSYAELSAEEAARQGLTALDPVDYAWLRMDDPTNLMMINGVMAFEGDLPLARLRRLVERRLLPIPRFQQRVVYREGGGLPFWQSDPGFDLEAHLYETTLPPGSGDAELRGVVRELMSQPLDPQRPLWSFHLIHNYEGGSAMMGRLHHCIGDGMALMLVLLSLTDTEPLDASANSSRLDGSPELTEALRQATEHGTDEAEQPSTNPFLRLFTGTKEEVAAGIHRIRERAEAIMPEGMNLLLRPAEAFRKAGGFATGVASAGALSRMTFRSADPATAFKGPLGVEKRATWSRPVPVELVRSLKDAFPGTVNDLLMTAMTGSLRRYLVGIGETPREDLRFRAAVPVNLRGLEEMAALGNQFGLVFLDLPVGIVSPLERLVELQRRMRRLRRSAEPLVVYQLLKLIGSMPKVVQQAVVSLFAQKTTAVMTNVPGPSQQLYLTDTLVRSLFFWVPQAGRVGLGISIFSYAGSVRMGVATDAGLVPDPEPIIDGFHAELEHMLRH